MAGTSALPLPRGRRPISWTAIGGIIAVVVILLILGYTGVLAQVRQSLPFAPSQAPVYQTSPTEHGNVAVTVTATGPVSAVNVLPLTFKESGRLGDLKASVGDKVTKGQVLADLDTTDLKNTLDQAKANLLVQQSALAKLQAGPTAAQKDVAQASVDSARSSADDATNAISTSKSTAGKSVETSRAGVASSATSLATAQAALTAAQDQETKQLAADQTAIANAQKSLDDTRASVAANVPILAQAIAKAKNDLYATQISRDAACAHPGAACNAGNASVNSAQTSLDTANAQAVAGQKSGAQSITSAQTALDQAKATATNDRAKLDASVVSAQNAVKQAVAALTSAQASLGQSQAQATATIQSAQSSADQAANALKTAQANYNQTVAPAIQADIDSAKAQVANAQAAVDAAQINFDSAVLAAPFDGTIAAVNGSVGQWISGGSVAATNGSTASATAIFTLMDLNNLQVVSQVNEADISKVQLGNTVNFDVSAFPNKTFTGKVIAVQPVGTTVQNVVNYNVTSTIQSTDKSSTLYPGMTATVTIIAAEHNGVTMVPNTAITFAQSALRSGLIGFNRQGNANGTPGPNRGQNNANGTPGPDQNRPQGQGNGNGGNGQGGQNQPQGLGGGSRGNGNGQGAGGNGGQRGNGGLFVQRSDGTQVGILVAMVDGKLTPKRVVLGLTDGTNTEVVSGLNGDETIVVGPTSRTTTTGTTNTNGQRPGGGGPPGGALFVGRGGD
jgi:HlyD family secretion protein